MNRDFDTSYGLASHMIKCIQGFYFLRVGWLLLSAGIIRYT